MANGQLYHCATENYFPDTAFSEATHIASREASDIVELQPADHPLFRQAAYFSCIWCKREYLGGIAAEGERERRNQEKKQHTRSYLRRVFIALLVLCTVLGALALLVPGMTVLAVYFGGIGILAIPGVLLSGGEYTIETLVIDATTGVRDDSTHILKLC